MTERLASVLRSRTFSGSARSRERAGAAIAMLLVAVSADARQSTTLVSRDAAGASVAAVCDGAGMSPDGRFVLFVSASSAPDPTIPPLSPMPRQLWMRDVSTGSNELISASTSGGYTIGFGASFGSVPNVAVSADGPFVAFDTTAPDLVPGDTNGRGDVFLRDRASGVTVRASVASDGSQLAEHSNGARVSDDGRYVLFATRAGGVVPGVAGGPENLYRRDLASGTTELVARESVTAIDGEIHADFSASGDVVAFATFQGLVPEDTNGELDVYVRDFGTGTLTLESAAPGGAAAGGYAPRLSADGGIVAFLSTATTLVPGDDNRRADVFVRTRSTGAVHVASRSSGGELIAPSADALSEFLLSRDGHHVAFHTKATNLVDADVNLDRYDVFVHDTDTGETELASIDSDGEQSPHAVTHANLGRALSADGRIVLFDSVHEFAPDDTSAVRSVFVHDRSIPTPRGFCFGSVAACPCGNAGDVGYGCQATNAVFGVRLTATGSARVSNDTLVVRSGPLLPGASALLFQGNARVNGGAGAHFGDGLRCAGGTTKRLGTKSSADSFFLFFGGPVGDLSLSANGGVPASGGTVHYQVWYRNAEGWCTASPFNTSSGLSITWLP